MNGYPIINERQKEITARIRKNELIIEQQLLNNGYDAYQLKTSGIYVLYRDSEEGLRYAYVGQATKNIVSRLAQHLSTYQHIDLSLRKRGWYEPNHNQFGYKIRVLTCPAQECDRLEQQYIKEWNEAGFWLLNATTGSQSAGKTGVDTQKAPKGYHDGLKQGYTNARRDVAKWFKHSLKVEINGKDGVRKQKALEQFNEFKNITGEGSNEDE